MRAALDAAHDAAARRQAAYGPLRDAADFSRALDVEALRAAFLAGSAYAALAPAAARTSADGTPAALLTPAPEADEPPLAPPAALRVAAGAVDLLGISGPVTLDTFGELLSQLAAQARDVEALPPTVDVGAMRVGAAGLKASLAAWPARRAAELRAMLPRLARGARCAWLLGLQCSPLAMRRMLAAPSAKVSQHMGRCPPHLPAQSCSMHSSTGRAPRRRASQL